MWKLIRLSGRTNEILLSKKTPEFQQFYQQLSEREWKQVEMLVASPLSLCSNREMQDMQSLKSFCEVIQCVKVSLISSLCKLHFHFAFVLRYVPHKNKALWSTTTTVGN